MDAAKLGHVEAREHVAVAYMVGSCVALLLVVLSEITTSPHTDFEVQFL